MKLIKNKEDLSSAVEYYSDVWYAIDEEYTYTPPNFPFFAYVFSEDGGYTCIVVCTTVDHAEELIKVARRMMPILE